MPAGEVTVLVVGVALSVAGAGTLAHALVQRRPHARLMLWLCLAGWLALATSLVIAQLHVATAETPRFYHGMLTGLGIGALVASCALYLLDAFEQRAGHVERTDRRR